VGKTYWTVVDDDGDYGLVRGAGGAPALYATAAKAREVWEWFTPIQSCKIVKVRVVPVEESS